MSVKAEVEGIGTLEFPDGTDPAVIQSTVKKMVATQGAAHPEHEAASTKGNLGASLKAAGRDVLGVAEVAGSAIANIPHAAAHAVQDLSRRLTGGDPDAPDNGIVDAIKVPVGKAGQDLVKGAESLVPKRYTGPQGQDDTNVPEFSATTQDVIKQTGQVVGDVGSLVPVGALGKAVIGTKPVVAATAAATASAKAYATRIGLDWDSLAAKTRDTLTSVAKDTKNLDNLDPVAVKRVARAQAVGAPISRGQATRDLEQITHEENISRSSSGKPVRDINTDQDLALHKKLESVRPPSKVETRSQLGESVQGAERGKLRSLEADYRAKYRKAKQSGETAGPVDATPLDDWLNIPANKRNAGYLRQALEDYKKDPSGSIRINDLEEVRKEANVKVGSVDKTEAYYAKQAVKVIDDILDQAGGDAYKNARKAFAKTKDEFDRQGLIKSLTSSKGRTTDRAVALEDTFDKVVRSGSNEQLKGLVDSLTKGGTAKTRAAGAQAVDDLRAATIDYLKEQAAGKRGIRGEKEQLQFNSSFIDAVDELDKDGKLDTLFGPKAKAELRQLREVTRDLRTKPADRIAGPNTTPRMVAILDKLSKIPGAGTIGTLVKKGYEKVMESSDAKAATRNPLDEAAAATTKRKHTLQDLKTSVPVSVGSATLQDNQ